MTTDRAAEFQRQKHIASNKRSRLRKAGLLPPLPLCPCCGTKCANDRWLPLCAVCGGGRNRWGERTGHQARPLRLMAEEIIRELRAEARGGV